MSYPSFVKYGRISNLYFSLVNVRSNEHHFNWFLSELCIGKPSNLVDRNWKAFKVSFLKLKEIFRSLNLFFKIKIEVSIFNVKLFNFISWKVNLHKLFAIQSLNFLDFKLNLVLLKIRILVNILITDWNLLN